MPPIVGRLKLAVKNLNVSDYVSSSGNRFQLQDVQDLEIHKCNDCIFQEKIFAPNYSSLYHRSR